MYITCAITLLVSRNVWFTLIKTPILETGFKISVKILQKYSLLGNCSSNKF